MPKSKKVKVYQIKITLKDIEPPIWRRLSLSGELDLDQIHDIFQWAMGWRDMHLHVFIVGDIEFGVPDPDAASDSVLDESIVMFSDLSLQEGSRFQYDYDFGDGWEHEVIVEKITEAVLPPVGAFLGGERACPPEDCGGPGGYQLVLEVMRNKRHPEHKELMEWMGDNVFDPEAYDPADINEYLASFNRQK